VHKNTNIAMSVLVLCTHTHTHTHTNLLDPGDELKALLPFLKMKKFRLYLKKVENSLKVTQTQQVEDLNKTKSA
jgi:hypothetical protein